MVCLKTTTQEVFKMTNEQILTNDILANLQREMQTENAICDLTNATPRMINTPRHATNDKTINRVERRIKLIAQQKVISGKALIKTIRQLKQYGITEIEKKYIMDLIKPRYPTIENQFNTEQRIKHDYRILDKVLKQRRKIYKIKLSKNKQYQTKQQSISQVLNRNLKSRNIFKTKLYIL